MRRYEYRNPVSQVPLFEFTSCIATHLNSLLFFAFQNCTSSRSTLWSTAPEWMPQSFSDLLDALIVHSSLSVDQNGMQSTQQTNDGLIIDPTSSALCMVVARVASQRPNTLLPSVLSMKGRVEIKIEVILNMLDQLPTRQSDGDDNDSLHHAATKMLLQSIDSVPYLRSRLRSDPSFFYNVPSKLIVPEIVQYLVTKYAQRKPDAGASSLAGLLCNIMTANANNGRAEDFIGCLMSSLQDTDRGDGSQESHTAFFNKNGPIWRLALLDESSSSASAYKDILLATAKSMIEMPSSITPLALLASLVDSQYRLRSSEDDATVRLEKRIFLATAGIIHFSVNHIPISHEDDDVNEMSIFGRLAPLLILRRMPRSYYNALHQALLSDKETYDVVVGLVAFLSDSLKSHAVRNDQGNLAREEKKLLAELAGHCLPLSRKVNREPCGSPDTNVLPVSLYENICVGPFTDTLKLLRREDEHVPQSDADTNQKNRVDEYPGISTIVGIRQAKAALYAVSHHVALGLDEDDGEALINVASFAFEVLNFQTGLACVAETSILSSDGKAETSILLREEMAMLQSGCTHFLVISVDSLSCRKARNIGPSEPYLIEDVECQIISRGTKGRSHSFLGALSEILHTLKSTIITGESAWSAIHFSPSSRTAMLNSFVMLAQGSRAEDGRLAWLASEILPTFVEWTSRGPVDEDIHHALCIAASLQVTYTLLARCGSFDFLGCSNNNNDKKKETDFVRRTLRCALVSFHDTGVGGAAAEANSPSSASCGAPLLRLAALKVILAVIALSDRRTSDGTMNPSSPSSSASFSGRGGDLGGYLSPAEVRRAISALHGAANVDRHPEVRRMANDILPYLH